MVSRLKEKGYPAYISLYRTRKGKTLYKVRIGRYETRGAANRVSRQYREAGGGE